MRRKPDDLRKKFLDACKDDGHQWCIEVKRMDNPAISSVRSRIFPTSLEMWREESRAECACLCSCTVCMWQTATKNWFVEAHFRAYAAIATEHSGGRRRPRRTRTCKPPNGFAGTALGAFGSAEGGIPSTIIAPSLLLEEVEIRGFHGEPRRLPLVPAPPLK